MTHETQLDNMQQKMKEMSLKIDLEQTIKFCSLLYCIEDYTKLCPVWLDTGMNHAYT